MESSRTKKFFAPIASAGLACALAATVAVPAGLTAHAAEDTGTSGSTEQTTEQKTEALQRLYNPNTGEHFYTSDSEEVLNLKALGWTDEGVGWTAPKESETPVYRLYNPYAPGGDHHYTTSEEEYNALKDAGWVQEGVAFYSASETTGVKIFRWYNPYAASGTHHYTGSDVENSAIAQAGWSEEGIGFYGIDTSTPEPTPTPDTDSKALPTDGVTISIDKVTYDGSEHKPTVTIEGLTEGTDFQVTYPEDMTNAGTKTVTVTGMGDYSGTQTLTYEIEKADVTVTLTGEGSSVDSPVVIYQDTEATSKGLSNYISFDANDGDETKTHLTYTVKCGDKEVAGTFSFTGTEGSDFTPGDVMAAPTAYGITFTPTDSNYNTVEGSGTGDAVTDPVVYVQVQQKVALTYTLSASDVDSALRETAAKTVKFTTGEEVPAGLTSDKYRLQSNIAGSGKIGLFLDSATSTAYIAPMDEKSTKML